MDLEKKIERLEKKMNKLLELCGLKEKDWWKPNENGKYYFLSDTLEVVRDIWNGFGLDEERYSIGNVFKKQEEAEFLRERLKVMVELKHFARPFRHNETNHYIYFNNDYNEVEISSYVSFQKNELYFESESKAKQAIDTIGIDRIKKYYLMVQEG